MFVQWGTYFYGDIFDKQSYQIFFTFNAMIGMQSELARMTLPPNYFSRFSEGSFVRAKGGRTNALSPVNA